MTGSRVTARAVRWKHGWELWDGDEVLTQSGTLADAVGEVQDYLATALGGDPEDYLVSIEVDLGGAEADVSEAARMVADSQVASVAAANRWRQLAARLRFELGLSVRDTATVMGISPGRVSQLVDSGAQRPSAAASTKRGTAMTAASNPSKAAARTSTDSRPDTSLESTGTRSVQSTPVSAKNTTRPTGSARSSRAR